MQRAQGEIINETGTMTGGGGRPRGGRMCLGNGAPKVVDVKEAAAELARAEKQAQANEKVDVIHFRCLCLLCKQDDGRVL